MKLHSVNLNRFQLIQGTAWKRDVQTTTEMCLIKNRVLARWAPIEAFWIQD